MSKETNNQKENSLISNSQMIKDTKGQNANITKPQEDTTLIPSITSSKQFTYLKQVKSFPFTFSLSSLSSLSFIKHKYNLVFCIPIASDSIDCSTQLKLTVDSIYKNISHLSEFNIKSNNVLLCLFIKEINKETNFEWLYTEEDQVKQLYKNSEQYEYLCNFLSCVNLEQTDNTIDALMITKRTSMTDIEIPKVFYSAICESIRNDLKTNTDPIADYVLYSIMMKIGVILSDSSVKNMILSAKTNEHKSVCVVPSIEIIPMGVFSHIKQYELVHTSIYDNHFYNAISYVSASSTLCLIKVSQSILATMKLFYESRINLSSSIEYHDWKLSLCLNQLGYKVVYQPCIEGHIMMKYITYTDLMNSYNDNIKGRLAVNYDLLLDWIFNWNICNVLSKIFLAFRLIGTLFEMLLPAFFLMVLYTIFYEGFGLTTNGSGAYFFTAIYVVLIALFTFISLSSTKSNKISFILYIIYELYILIALLTSIAAMHYVRINKHNSSYKFNTAAIVILILLNFIFGVIPMCINIRKILINIVDMLLYLVLGCPNYTSVFLITGIVNMSDSYGHSEDIDDSTRKLSIVSIWFVVNVLISMFVLLMDTRSARVNCVLALSIIFTIYNIVKVVAIVYSKYFIVGNNERSLSEISTVERIKSAIEKSVEKKEERKMIDVNSNNDLISSDRGKKNSYTGDTYNNSNLNSHNNESAIIAQNIDDGDNHKPY